MSEGYIYIMTNPCLHDMVKIGYASDVEARRKQLSTTALVWLLYCSLGIVLGKSIKIPLALSTIATLMLLTSAP